jgi:hypothetical protein
LEGCATRFTKWVAWSEREKVLGDKITLPGVYALAVSEGNLSDKPFSWIENIECIGMTNSRGGLKSRLKQLLARSETPPFFSMWRRPVLSD